MEEPAPGISDWKSCQRRRPQIDRKRRDSWCVGTPVRDVIRRKDQLRPSALCPLPTPLTCQASVGVGVGLIVWPVPKARCGVDLIFQLARVSLKIVFKVRNRVCLVSQSLFYIKTKVSQMKKCLIFFTKNSPQEFPNKQEARNKNNKMIIDIKRNKTYSY